MTKSRTFVVLAALLLAVAGCTGNPPQQTSGLTSSEIAVAPSSDGAYSPLMVPIRFLE